MAAQKFGISESGWLQHQTINFLFVIRLKKHFQQSSGGHYPKVEFPFFDSSFWSFPFSQNFPAILFWNQYNDTILYHTEKKHTLDLIAAVPYSITPDILITKKIILLHEVKISKFVHK